MFARYYNSATGRFLSPDWDAKSSDPVPYAKLDDPQSLNLYSYVRNNPLSRTDPDGHVDDEKKKHHHVKKPKPSTQQESPYEANNREANVVYHETSALKPIPGKSDTGDLHGARVDGAHVYNNLTNQSKFQDTGKLNAQEQKSLAGGYPPAVNGRVAQVPGEGITTTESGCPRRLAFGHLGEHGIISPNFPANSHVKTLDAPKST